jgi:hypothetical protein
MTDISGSNTVSDGYNKPYTPTTEEVRESYVLMQKCSAYPNPDAEFDRWLAEHDAEIAKRAWEEGHKTAWKRGPSECKCYAYSSSECGCGKYGTGELLSLNDNPYLQGENN